MSRHVVNLIPWREQRRYHCRRFWLLFFVLALMGISLVTMGWQGSASLRRQDASLWLQSDADVLSRIASREPLFQAKHAQWLKLQASARQRQITRLWHQRLGALAERMPESAWLTTLHFHEGKLELMGATRSFAALSQLEQALSTTQGFRLQPTGATERDAQGHWQFRYQLEKETEDAP